MYRHFRLLFSSWQYFKEYASADAFCYILLEVPAVSPSNINSNSLSLSLSTAAINTPQEVSKTLLGLLLKVSKCLFTRIFGKLEICKIKRVEQSQTNQCKQKCFVARFYEISLNARLSMMANLALNELTL